MALCRQQIAAHGGVAGSWLRAGICLAIVSVTGAAATIAGPGQNRALSSDNRPARTVTQTPVRWNASDCSLCHSGMDRSIFSHPVDIRPSFRIPASLPLEAGLVTCVTCHRDDAASHGASRDLHDGFLRSKAVGKAQCAQCHQRLDGTANRAHAISLGRAHLGVDKQAALSFGQPTGDRAIEQESRTCMSCHDGSVAKDLGVGHPVGVSYEDPFRRSERRRRLSLTPAHRLDPRVRLFDGQVGCGSCHSPYAGHKKMLVIPNDRGGLCKSCHGL